jgi:Xaa-Pro dipeptidase
MISYRLVKYFPYRGSSMQSTVKEAYPEHLARVKQTTLGVLEACELNGLIIDGGRPQYYFSDDAYIPYRPTPHLIHWGPIPGHSHVLIFDPKKEKPVLLYYNPKDFWHDSQESASHFWENHFEIQSFLDYQSLEKALSSYSDFAYVGPSRERTELQHKELISRLDWERTQKTPYEILCLKEANKKALKGHRAAKEAFLDGKSEFEIFLTYLQIIEDTERNLPYSGIFCLNEKCGVLHYEKKRLFPRNGRSFLCDAGASVLGYGSDITRTYGKPGLASDVFLSLLDGMEKIQKALCLKVQSGCDFTLLHEESISEIANLLLNENIINGLSLEALVESGLVKAFYPHGLGHMLGLQVHDVGGRQIDPQGTAISKDAKHPLRTTRVLRENEVVTIEPGVYFIPMLLEAEREKEHKKHINWSLIEELYPCGGIRIEDNIVARNKNGENLTQE